MIPRILLLMLCFCALGTHAQEICDNGIDDDGDDLIDHYDPDCCGTNEHFEFICDTICKAKPFDYSIGVIWESEAIMPVQYSPVVGDLDGDELPEIVCGAGLSGEVRVFDGVDGALKYSFSHPTATLGWSAALADLDADGRGDIVMLTREGYIAVFDHLGQFKYGSTERVTYGSLGLAGYYDMFISVADFNQDGAPEIIVNNKIFNGQDATLICAGGSDNNMGFGQNDAVYQTVWQKNITTAIDILPDDHCASCQGLELVAGNQIFAVDIASGQMQVVSTFPVYPDAFTYVADHDADGDLDVICLSNDTDASGERYFRAYVWDGQTPSAIAVSDLSAFDGLQIGGAVSANIDDDVPLEFVIKIDQQIVALDSDLSVMWYRDIDDGSSVQPVGFDFNTDGKVEIVFRDDSDLYILNGRDGSILSQIVAPAPTASEAMVVADVNDDNIADILFDRDGSLTAVSIIDGMPWAGARPVFNQPHYFNIHINDDLIVPAVQQYPLAVYDNKFMNNCNVPMAVPDQILEVALEVDTLRCDDSVRVSFSICNRGGQQIPSSLPVAFYCGDENITNLELLHTSQIGMAIDPDSCLTYEYVLFIDECSLIFGVVNDDGSTILPIDIPSIFPITNFEECTYDNNWDSVSVNIVESPSMLGVDTFICHEDQFVLRVADQFDHYLWSDGSVADTLIVGESGIYWVEGQIGCYTFRDSLSVDFITPFYQEKVVYICENDSIFIEGIWIKDAGEYEYVRSSNTCDSTFLYLVNVIPQSVKDTFIQMCAGDSIYLNNTWIFSDTTFSAYLSGSGECPTLVNYDVDVEKLQATFPSDTSIQAGSALPLNVDFLGEGLIRWEPIDYLSCSDCFSTVVTPIESKEYTITIEGESGCIISENVTVQVLKDLMVYIPSAFSPNGDGINDRFIVHSNGTEEVKYSMQIFNRWGGLVFDRESLISNSQIEGWDGYIGGKMAETGVFVYKIILHYDTKDITKTGEVLLIK